ncbi:MAG: radical SAM protein [Candidatus Hadarchaeum sp.]|uniref:radical SAM protein n=1 Tax=Candidatus Hadarchaeum sp. TaxID=2883567 RepID=UPI003D0D2700
MLEPAQNRKLSKVRVAFGTGAVLGLWHGKLIEAPTTAHFLTYFEGRCRGNCKFCPQARESTADLEMLSRVVWPKFDLESVLTALSENSEKFKRVCIQAVNSPSVVEVIGELVSRVREVCRLPISVSCQPLTLEELEKLSASGVERVGLAFDAATKEIFSKVKGSEYSWEGHMAALKNAQLVFGDRVSTHLIVGLGESEEEMVRALQFFHDGGVTVALFAFTPIPGTPLSKQPRPDVASYRRVQLARFLIANNLVRAEEMKFEGGRIFDFGADGESLRKIVESGDPFITSGCAGCNRPFYNESPRGPIYNYPRKPNRRDLDEIKKVFGLPG